MKPSDGSRAAHRLFDEELRYSTVPGASASASRAWARTPATR
jgi:hypothetical protein